MFSLSLKKSPVTNTAMTHYREVRRGQARKKKRLGGTIVCTSHLGVKHTPLPTVWVGALEYAEYHEASNT